MQSIDGLAANIAHLDPKSLGGSKEPAIHHILAQHHHQNYHHHHLRPIFLGKVKSQPATTHCVAQYKSHLFVICISYFHSHPFVSFQNCSRGTQALGPSGWAANSSFWLSPPWSSTLTTSCEPCDQLTQVQREGSFQMLVKASQQWGWKIPKIGLMGGHQHPGLNQRKLECDTIVIFIQLASCKQKPSLIHSVS